MCFRLKTRKDIGEGLILLGILQGAHQVVPNSVVFHLHPQALGICFALQLPICVLGVCCVSAFRLHSRFQPPNGIAGPVLV